MGQARNQPDICDANVVREIEATLEEEFRGPVYLDHQGNGLKLKNLRLVGLVGDTAEIYALLIVERLGTVFPCTIKSVGSKLVVEFYQDSVLVLSFQET